METPRRATRLAGPVPVRMIEVNQRQRLLINARGRSSESRNGENSTYGLTRGPMEGQQRRTVNPPPISKEGRAETLDLKLSAQRFYSTRSERLMQAAPNAILSL